jgi:SAM-dependent methyltransferase
MGTGSGSGSAALASLYPALGVLAVDVNPTMVALARESYPRENLGFVCADIATHCFRPATLDGIFDSSVLHHVTTFSGYDHDAAERCLAVQAAELRDHGTLIVRDFLDPGPGDVLLDLCATDGEAGDDPASCSTAALFERFAREFRKLSAAPGFSFDTVAPDPEAPRREGFRRYRVAHKLAVEFVLRKDYRRDWASEVLEEYTYFSQERFEATFARLGLRLLTSTPLRNPWIVRHRFRDRFEMRDGEGRRLEYPPTNYVIVGEKVPSGEGVALSEGEPGAAGFLRLDHHRHRPSGEVRDLVRRPHPTIDLLPWFEVDGDVYVLARRSYPRPILRCRSRGTVPLDGSRAPGYVTEPLSVIQRDEPLGRTVEEALALRAGIAPGQIRGMRPGCHYYPSPGGIEEEVRSVFVEIDPVFVEQRVGDVSGFSTSGVVHAIEARQVLRAAQVGALPDARLEINVQGLLNRLGLDPGPWIGEAIELAGERTGPPPPVTSLAELGRRPPRRLFEPARPQDSPGFLDLQAATFEERAADGSIVGRRTLEFVVPRHLSFNTVAVALLARFQGETWMGLDDDDLPAAQSFGGNSQILVAPAWRLPRTVRGLDAAREFAAGALQEQYGARIGTTWELGGRYHPSPGLTPEVVYPLAMEVVAESPAPRSLEWVPLRQVSAHLDAVRDGHLLALWLRAAHAAGVLAAWPT